MKSFFVLLFLFCFSHAKSENVEKKPVFRLHLFSEPTTLSPFLQKNSASLYFLGQISAPLLQLKNGELSPYVAHCKQLSGKKISCKLNPEAKWSDGKPITAQEYINMFQAFVEPTNLAFRADILFPIRNAEKIYKGELKAKQLGVSEKKGELIFQLEKEDLEFIYNLASPLFSPLRETHFSKTEDDMLKPSPGPYRITSWEKGKKISLENNPFFLSNTNRPNLEFQFIIEDSVALGLYDKNELDLLRRLPSSFIPKYKTRPDFYDIPVFRFDYIGFSSSLPLELRKALSLSIPYDELVKLYSAKPRPGCPGLPETMVGKLICHDYKPTEAKEILAQLNKENISKKLELMFSLQGSDDHVRSMQFFQALWQKNLGLEIKLNQQDNKAFQARLKSEDVTMFRKGLSPDRPTCRSTLEYFLEDSGHNFLKLNIPELKPIIEKMTATKSAAQTKALCQKGLSLLIENYHLIPLGPMYFSILAKPQWQGWSLNELNQLDLTNLKFVK
jgi:oligopeptide transport system substrate-binding protein